MSAENMTGSEFVETVKQVARDKKRDQLLGANPCPACSALLSPCVSAQEGMAVRAWYCAECGYIDKARNRERQIKATGGE